jgi:CHAT domain-containing protein
VEIRLREQDSSGALEIWEWYKTATFRSFRESSNIAVSSMNEGLEGRPRPEQPAWSAPDAVSIATKKMGTNTFVSYAHLPGGFVVWTADDRGLQSKWLPGSSKEIERNITNFKKACSSPSSDLSALHAEAKALYELLIAPISDRLTKGRTLVFEGDGAIAEAPMQALIDREGRYLAESFDLVWSEGLHYETNLRTAVVISPQSSALVVAVSGGGTSEAHTPVPDVVQEASAVAKRFLSSRLLVGSDASVTQVRRGLASAAVFHFAGHAGAGTDGIGLILSSDNGRQGRLAILSVEELAPEHLSRLQLAVLSACSTEMGKDAGISDPDSLVRFFLRAGVPHIVGTRWNLDSSSAVIFTEKFYDSLLTGNTPARALNEAAARVRSFPETAHPYYWAGFNVFGKS